MLKRQHVVFDKHLNSVQKQIYSMFSRLIFALKFTVWTIRLGEGEENLVSVHENRQYAAIAEAVMFCLD
jgi:hypothetical protein